MTIDDGTRAVPRLLLPAGVLRGLLVAYSHYSVSIFTCKSAHVVCAVLWTYSVQGTR